MRRYAITALALGLATLVFAPPAGAQDAGGAPEVAGDPIKFSDRDDCVEVELPRNWKSQKVDPSRGELGFWSGPATERFHAAVRLRELRNVRRAPLGPRMMHGPDTEIIEGSVTSGDGWKQLAAIDDEQQRAYWERYIESGEGVYVIRVLTHSEGEEPIADLAAQILASVKVVKPIEPAKLDDAFDEMKVKDYLVVTDLDKDKRDDAEGLVKGLLDIRKMAGKTFDGKPFITTAPVVRIYQNGKTFNDDSIKAVGREPERAVYDAKSNSVYIKWMSRNAKGFDEAVAEWAAQQTVTEHFGGPLPYWLDVGLRLYIVRGVQDGMKFKKMDRDRGPHIKKHVAGESRKLDQWFHMNSSDIPDTDRAAQVTYAWHWYLRHGGAPKSARKAYEDCLETLRDTGDLEAAYAHFADIDMADLLQSYKSWAQDL